MVLVGTGRRVLEQEKQVTNWINSGHVPRRYIENNNCETTGRHCNGRYRHVGSALRGEARERGSRGT